MRTCSRSASTTSSVTDEERRPANSAGLHSLPSCLGPGSLSDSGANHAVEYDACGCSSRCADGHKHGLGPRHKDDRGHQIPGRSITDCFQLQGRGHAALQAGPHRRRAKCDRICGKSCICRCIRTACFELIVSIVMVALDSRFLDRAVDALDLAIGPGMLEEQSLHCRGTIQR